MAARSPKFPDQLSFFRSPQACPRGPARSPGNRPARGHPLGGPCEPARSSPLRFSRRFRSLLRAAGNAWAPRRVLSRGAALRNPAGWRGLFHGRRGDFRQAAADAPGALRCCRAGNSRPSLLCRRPNELRGSNSSLHPRQGGSPHASPAGRCFWHALSGDNDTDRYKCFSCRCSSCSSAGGRLAKKHGIGVVMPEKQVDAFVRRFAATSGFLSGSMS